MLNSFQHPPALIPFAREDRRTLKRVQGDANMQGVEGAATSPVPFATLTTPFSRHSPRFIHKRLIKRAGQVRR
jgi:hypothetical protein